MKASSEEVTAEPWQKRLAHLNKDDLKRLVKMSKGLSLSGSLDAPCEPCVLSKMHRMPNRKSTHEYTATRPGEVWHVDLCGGGETLSPKGYRCFLALTDMKTRYRHIIPLKQKSEAAAALETFLKWCETQFGYKRRACRGDLGGEFVACEKVFDQRGIQWEPAAAAAKEQNGIAERTNRVLIERARTMLIEAKLPKSFWIPALETSAYISNRIPSKHNTKKTPQHQFTKEKPDLSHLRTFGCTVYVYNEHAKKGGKMAPRAEKLILMGYTKTSHNYLVYNPFTRNFYERRDVIFDEKTPGILKTTLSVLNSTPNGGYSPDQLRTVWDWAESKNEDNYYSPKVTVDEPNENERNRDNSPPPSSPSTTVGPRRSARGDRITERPDYRAFVNDKEGTKRTKPKVSMAFTKVVAQAHVMATKKKPTDPRIPSSYPFRPQKWAIAD